jgi:peptidoglycan/xylan/chitin deacetylase (PgdA/CDA1 family)
VVTGGYIKAHPPLWQKIAYPLHFVLPQSNGTIIVFPTLITS